MRSLLQDAIDVHEDWRFHGSTRRIIVTAAFFLSGINNSLALLERISHRSEIPLLFTAPQEVRAFPSTRRRPSGVVLVLLGPGELDAEELVGLLDRMGSLLAAWGLELQSTVVPVRDDGAGEGTILDVVEHRAHVVLHVLIDRARCRDVVTLLCPVGTGPALPCDANLVDRVDSLLHLVAELEVPQSPASSRQGVGVSEDEVAGTTDVPTCKSGGNDGRPGNLSTSPQRLSESGRCLSCSLASGLGLPARCERFDCIQEARVRGVSE